MANSDTGQGNNGRPDGDPEGLPEDSPETAPTPAFGEPGFEAPAELKLGDDDTALPWLEGDDEDDRAVGYNTGQLIAFVLLGLAALALLVGGIWWATRDKGDSHVVADGSVIKAPEGPYKERPKDPGGKTFEGTGDSSFKVSDGQSQKAELGKSDAPAPAAPKPGFETVGKRADDAGKPVAADASGVGVQVAAYSNRAQAEAGWARLSQQYSALSGMRYRIVEGQADIGTVYRLQALPGDVKAANALCGTLKKAGLNCNVKQ